MSSLTPPSDDIGDDMGDEYENEEGLLEEVDDEDEDPTCPDKLHSCGASKAR